MDGKSYNFMEMSGIMGKPQLNIWGTNMSRWAKVFRLKGLFGKESKKKKKNPQEAYLSHLIWRLFWKPRGVGVGGYLSNELWRACRRVAAFSYRGSWERNEKAKALRLGLLHPQTKTQLSSPCQTQWRQSERKPKNWHVVLAWLCISWFFITGSQ